MAPVAAASLILVAAGLGIAFADRGDDDVLRNEAFVSVTTDLSSSSATSEVPAVTAPSTTATGASNDSVRSIVTTTTAPPPPTTDPATADERLPDVESRAPKPPPTVRSTVATTAPPTSPPATPRPAPPAVDAPTAPPPAAPPAESPPAAAPPAPAPAAPPAAPPAPDTTAPPTPAPTPAPALGRLSVGGSSISLGSGSGSSSGSVGLTNLGDLPVTISVGGNTGPFSVSPVSGTLPGGESMSINASIDRSNLAEGSGPTGSITISGGDGSSFTVGLSAQVERPPVISGAFAANYCGELNAGISASVGISDESSVSANFFVSGPGGRSTSDAMGPDGATWSGNVILPFVASTNDDPLGVNGTWSWSMTSTDARSNTSSASGSTTVDC